MPWLTPSTTQVAQTVTSVELDTIAQLAAPGAPAPAPGDPPPQLLLDIFANAIALVRGEVGRRYRLGPDGTLPSSLVSTAQDITRYRVLAVVPAGELITEARTKLYNDAIAYLKRIATGDAAVEELTGTEYQRTTGGATLAGRTRLHFTRRDTRRL